MTKRSLVKVALAGLLVAVVVSAAPASHVRVPDPRETDGVLDVRVVTASGAARVTWKIVTWDRWTTRSIRDRGYALVYLDTFGGARADYYALVRSVGSRLVASLWRDRAERPDVRMGRLRVRRPGPASLTVTVSLERLNLPVSRLEYGWRVQTLLSGARCARVCFDRAPDQGFVAEPNPQAAPTPSPSGTPLPTPTVLTPRPDGADGHGG